MEARIRLSRGRGRQYRFRSASLELGLRLSLAALLLLLFSPGLSNRSLLPTCRASTEELFGVPPQQNSGKDDDDEDDEVAFDGRDASEITTEEKISWTNKPGGSASVQKESSTITNTKSNSGSGKVWGTGSSSLSRESQEKNHSATTMNAGQQQQQQLLTHPSLPFVKTIQHGPPEGFELTARVYTDKTDKLAYVDDYPSQQIVIPYRDCGVQGEITTAGLPVSTAFWRHARSKPSVFTSGTGSSDAGTATTTPTSQSSGGMGSATEAFYPQLLICLTPIRMELNSGQARSFNTGDVVLLENIVAGGHKLFPQNEATDMTVLFLTLPFPYHSIGKDQTCLDEVLYQDDEDYVDDFDGPTMVDPCPLPDEEGEEGSPNASSKGVQQLPHARMATTAKKRRRRATGLHIRQMALGTLGASLSLLLADFLGKVAPLWLSVGVGGTALVAGGTWGVMMGGTQLLDQLELRQRARRLQREQEQLLSLQQNGSGQEDDVSESIAGEENLEVVEQSLLMQQLEEEEPELMDLDSSSTVLEDAAE